MVFDCVIVGSGPAGLTAGIYLARANKKVAILEKMAIGGQVSEIGIIENYPGFFSISGSELSMNMYNQAKKLGVEFITEEVVSYDLREEIKKVNTSKKEIETTTIILALGSVARTLNAENEKKFIGKGVSYCATCDGHFFKGKKVAVVGSGDTAVSNAQYLSNLAERVYIVSKYAPMKLRNSKMEDLEKLSNVEIFLEAKALSIIGEDKVEALEIQHNGQRKQIKIEGIFVSIGRNPDTENLHGEIELDEKGYILADAEMKTSQEGVFAAGDIVSGSVKQIVTAASLGAIASYSVIKYLNSRK